MPILTPAEASKNRTDWYRVRSDLGRAYILFLRLGTNVYQAFGEDAYTVARLTSVPLISPPNIYGQALVMFGESALEPIRDMLNAQGLRVVILDAANCRSNLDDLQTYQAQTAPPAVPIGRVRAVIKAFKSRNGGIDTEGR